MLKLIFLLAYVAKAALCFTLSNKCLPLTTSLLVIDPQNDFINGTLTVPGALEDVSRSNDFLSKFSSLLDNIYVTLDTHTPNHIAHEQSLLKDLQGNELPNFTTVTVADIENGKVIVKEGMKEIVLQYLKDLEQSGKYQYTKWPVHCVKDTHGHLVHSELQNQLNTWTNQSGKQVHYIEKGSNDFTEMYSALSAEVPQENDSSTQLNTELIKSLNKNDYVIVFGQAKSHCVKSTVEDYLNNIGPTTKIILLKDLTSSVPGFHHLGDELEKTLIDKGHFVSTSDNLNTLLMKLEMRY